MHADVSLQHWTLNTFIETCFYCISIIIINAYYVYDRKYILSLLIRNSKKNNNKYRQLILKIIFC